jgi:hypothetical protein
MPSNSVNSSSAQLKFVQYKSDGASVTLDTTYDTYLQWSIESTPEKGHVYYAESVSDIDTTKLNLTSPNDFSPDTFKDSTGIWYFAHTVLFENSENPLIVNTTYFQLKAGHSLWSYITIRYFLFGNTTMSVFDGNNFCEEVTSKDDSMGWEGVGIDLDSCSGMGSAEFKDQELYSASVIC